jgi:hypothetical protein
MDTVDPSQTTRNNRNTTDWGSGMDARACKLLADEAMKEGKIVEPYLEAPRFNCQTRYSPIIIPRNFWVQGEAEIYDFCYGVMRKGAKEIVTQGWFPSEAWRRQ